MTEQRAICRVCRNRRLVRLPVEPEWGTRCPFTPGEAPPMEAALDYRDYPCPECSTDLVQARTVYAEYQVDTAYRVGQPLGVLFGQPFGDRIQRSLAEMIGRHLLAIGAISFTRRPGKQPLTDDIVATVGVVRPDATASIEDRMSARQGEAAAALAESVKASIRRWATENRDAIPIGFACYLIDGELGKVTAAQVRQATQTKSGED